MKFKVTVTYHLGDNHVMTKEMTGVERIELLYEDWNGKPTEVFRVHCESYKGATWRANCILNVNMTSERE